MTVPYNDDTRKSYVDRNRTAHLDLAETHCDLGNEQAAWVQLFTWVQAEEIYGTHWDKLKEKNT